MDRFKSVALFVVGASFVLFGWLFAGMEAYHVSRGAHVINWSLLFWSMFSVTFGAALIQFGSVKAAFDLMSSVLPILQSIRGRPGGDRAADPPPKPDVRPPQLDRADERGDETGG